MPLPVNGPQAGFFLLNTTATNADGISTLIVQLGGTAASTASAQVIAGEVTNALPNTAAEGAASALISDNLGRLVVTPIAPRSLVFDKTTTISATTAETTLIAAAGAGVFTDLTRVWLTNTSASVSTRVDFRDTAGGTVKFSLMAPANASTPVVVGDVPIYQSSANQVWTAQCAVATTDIRVYTQFTKNQL